MSYRLLACLPLALLAACSKSGDKSETTPTEAPSVPPVTFTGPDGFHNAVSCMVKMKALSELYDDLAKAEAGKPNTDVEMMKSLADMSLQMAQADYPYGLLARNLDPSGPAGAGYDAAKKTEDDLVASKRSTLAPGDFRAWLEKEVGGCPLEPPSDAPSGN